MISVSISLAVWSAVAELSIPSNLVPSAATSLPSTVPVHVMFPVTSIPAEKSWFPVLVIVPLESICNLVALLFVVS